MSAKSTPTRYGSVAIALHWASAALIVAAFSFGLVADSILDPAARLWIVRVHVTCGGLALLLTLTRIGWWMWGDKRPAPMPGLSAPQQWATRSVHALLYLAILVLGASGIGTLVLSGAIPALLAGTPLPNFSTVAPRLVHDVMSKLLFVLFVLHVAAALYHQLIRRDRLLARMGIGA